MLPSLLARLRDLCRDQSAYEQMQDIVCREFEQLQREQEAVSRVIAKIRASLDIETIFKTTAIEVRQLMNADRVAVFRFDPASNWSDGKFVSEDVLPGYESAIAAKIHDHCFGDRFAADYQLGRVQAVEDIHAANLSDCHIQILSQFQVRANLVVPLIKGSELWGLLCVHQCDAPRRWRSNEIKFVTQIAAQLGVALQQAELLEQTQRQTVELKETIATLQKTQMQLFQSEKMSGLGELVAGIAHEINNPVNFIYGNLNHATQYADDLLNLVALYQQLDAPAEKIADYAEAIDLDFLMQDLPKLLGSMQIGADRIRQIVLSLRNFSRLDEAEMKPVNIHDGLNSTLLILQYRLKAKAGTTGIRVTTEYEDLPLVECYASQLNQVFMNLISNAIDALSEAEKPINSCSYCQITIRTKLIEQPSGDTAVIEISDNGPGIPPEIQPKLFNLFFTTKPIGKGTGIGLSICHQVVVERHGGQLRCISEVGQGTTFAIEIPVQQSKAVDSSIVQTGDRVLAGQSDRPLK